MESGSGAEGPGPEPGGEPGGADFDATRLAAGSGGLPVPGEPSREGPSRIGPYRVLRRLGGGGMGHIYLAVQESIGRQVALKVLPPGLLEGSEAHERFQREIQVLGQLSHPNICPVLEAGRDGEVQYYAMEHLRGLDLAKVIRTQRVDPPRAAGIAVQVLRALQFAHDRGIVHRDVKPHNIMLSRGAKAREASGVRSGSSRFSLVRRFFGTAPGLEAPPESPRPASAPPDATLPNPEWEDHAVLIDFGLARDAAQRSTKLTITGAVVGTPAYMAPEQARGAPLGPACDVYAMGAVLYEMLALRPPFEGATIAEVLHAVIERDPRPLRALNPLLDRDLATVVAKAMEKDPARRYASAAAFADDLERWLAGEPILARPASLAYRFRRAVARNRFASAVAALAVALASWAAWRTARPGILAVDTDPPGAEVWLDDHLAGRTPLVTRAAKGTRRLQLRLAGHEAENDFPVIEPGGRTEVKRVLRHEKGFLTLTSLPEEVRLELSCGGKKVTTASPATEMPLDTGHWEGFVRAENHFSRPIAFDLAKGQRLAMHLTLDAMLVWQSLLREGAWGLAVVEATGDAQPDLVAVHGVPGSITALRGRDGAPLWTADLPPTRLGQEGRLRVADLDGDLRDEVLWRSGEKLWVFEAETGLLEQAIEGGEYNEFVPCADADGDGLTDLAVWSGSTCGVVRGRTGEPVWRRDMGGGIPNLREATVGAPARPGLIVGVGRFGARALDLRDGATVWESPGPISGSVTAADFTGDGVDDAGIPFAPGQYRVADGRDGREVWRREFPRMGYRGEDAAADVDGDGCEDLIRSGADSARLYVAGGRTGEVILKQVMVTEWAVPVVADLTGDGRPEFVVNADFGIVACDPRSGRMLWRFDDGRTGGMHPLLSDFDGDGFQDIAVQGASSVTVIRGCERPVQWRQRGGAYNMTDVVLLGRPPDSVFVPGTSLRLLDLRDGRILRENPEPHGNRATVRTIGDRQDVVLGWAPFRILRLPSLEHGEVLEGSESTTAALAFDANGDEYPDLLTGDRDVPHSLRAHDGRSLTVLWRSPVARTVHADAAAVAGLLWVPGVAGVHLLEPRDGRERAVWPLGGVASSVRPMGDGAVAATRSGRVARGRLSPRGDSVETLWSVETGLSLPPGAPATSGECVAVASTDGRVALLDGRTGAERWRTAARWPTDGGGSMNDCDGDGFPEVAVCTSRGLLAVLSGADGALLFSFRQGVEFGGASGVWCDIDGDGARELISSGRTGFVTAIRVPAGPPPIVHWPAPEVRSARAAGRATREFLASRRAEELLDRGDLQGLLALADAEPTRWTCTRAAVAARRLGRDADAVRFADEARRRGVRRLDVELARAASLPEPERSGAAVRALAAAPADQLEQAAVGESEKALWASVAAAAAEAAERNGFGDRAILISAQAGSWERIEEIERRAPAASLGRVLLAKSAAAARQNRWSDALAAIQAASEIGSVREDAARRRARLAGEAQASLEAARALAQAGHAADAVPLFDKACCLLPTNAEAWNEAAWLVATSSGVSPQHARAARAWAVVAVETHRKQSPGDGAKLSMYLDTLAAAHFACGDFEAAVRTQREALALPVPAAFLRDMQDALRKYEEALKGGSR